jgi:hypothetical protein
MSRNLTIPYFPNPPETYNQQYLSEVIRAFSLYVQQIQNPGEGRNTFTVFTDLDMLRLQKQTHLMFVGLLEPVALGL